VLRATDDCTTVLARVVDTKMCINILNPLSDMAECPMNLAAIKLEEKVIRSATEPIARAVMERVVPTLAKVSLFFKEILVLYLSITKHTSVPY